MVNIGDSVTETMEVTEDKLAAAVGSGDLRVLATPMVAALMESAAAQLVKEALEDGITTVGTAISIEHTSPTPIGVKVSAKATLVKVDGRMFYFDTKAYDDKGVIAKGTHTRVSVKAEKFQKKADEKFNEV